MIDEPHQVSSKCAIDGVFVVDRIPVGLYGDISNAAGEKEVKVGEFTIRRSSTSDLFRNESVTASNHMKR